MRIQVEHDQQGRIVNLVVLREKPGQMAFMALKPRGKNGIAYVEAREVASEQDFEKLREIKRSYRVEHHEGLHRLIRKQAQ